MVEQSGGETYGIVSAIDGGYYIRRGSDGSLLMGKHDTAKTLELMPAMVMLDLFECGLATGGNWIRESDVEIDDPRG